MILGVHRPSYLEFGSWSYWHDLTVYFEGGSKLEKVQKKIRIKNQSIFKKKSSHSFSSLTNLYKYKKVTLVLAQPKGLKQRLLIKFFSSLVFFGMSKNPTPLLAGNKVRNHTLQSMIFASSKNFNLTS